MAQAILEITADSSSVRRALGEIPEMSRRVSDAIKRDFGQLSAAGVAEFAKLSREAARNLAAITREEQKLSEARRRRAQTDTAVTMAEEQRQTQTSMRESERRTQLAARESEQTSAVKQREVTMVERIEREKTRIVERELNERARRVAAAERGAESGAGGEARPRGFAYQSRFGQVTFAAGRAAWDAMRNIHGAVQSAQATRAQTENTLNSAFYQAGAGAGDVGALHRTVFDFARNRGMDSSELAAAANAAQTEFSVFGDSRSSQADRQQKLRQFLGNAELARDTFQDVGQVARVAGLMQNAGITGETQRTALLGLTGMAQRGAIELGGVTREAMAPMQMRMANAVNRLRQSNPNASPEAIAHAQQQAMFETMAEMEVGRGLGFSPRQLGNVTASMETRLQSNVVQGRLLANIRNSRGLSQEQRSRLVSSLFETDARGQQHLQAGMQSTVGLARGLLAAGVDSTTAQNLLAGGGRGNPQSLQANERRIVAAMMGSEGNVRSLVEGAGRDFTERDVQRGREIVDNSRQNRLTQTEEERAGALTDNTSAIVNLSNRIAALSGSNPMATAIGGSVAGALGGTLIQRAGTFAITGAAGAGAAGAAGAGATGAAGTAGALPYLAGGAVALAAGLAAGDQVYSRLFDHGHHGQARSDSVFSGRTWNVLSNTSVDEVRSALSRSTGLNLGGTQQTTKERSAGKDGMSPDAYARALQSALRNTQLNVTLDTHALLAAAAQLATGGNAPPPEQRR